MLEEFDNGAPFMMPARPNPYSAAPELTKPLIDFAERAGGDVLDPKLKELVRIRVSQLNGCAICLQMHWECATRLGEPLERLSLLDAWRETALYSKRERSALAWAEALTRMPEGGPDDRSYAEMAAEFDLAGQIALSLVIAAINATNRIGVGFGVGPVPEKQLDALLEQVPA
jgi:AhpD family alkylhydroperoxidase